MSSIEKAIERFKKTSKYGSDTLDIDFALTESTSTSQHNSSNRQPRDDHNQQALNSRSSAFTSENQVPQRSDFSNDGLRENPLELEDEYNQNNHRPVEKILQNQPSRGGHRSHYSFNYTALAQQGFLTPNSERNVIVEEYRSLKRPILMNAFGRGAVPVENGNLVMVTSAIPGEGKTFSAFNLAMSMAMERDKTVLLIDSDVLRASMTKFLGLKDRIGLLEVLKDNSVTLHDTILKTDIPNFSILPAGQPQLNSTELLASEEMDRMMSDLSSRYPDRIIVFDAPPLIVTTEASVLAESMGQILMVVECGSTQQSIVTDALAQINKDKIIGLLLNKSRRSSRSEYYGGGGYYGS